MGNNPETKARYYQENKERLREAHRLRQQRYRQERKETPEPDVYLCVNHYKQPAVPLAVASSIVRDWSERNATDEETLEVKTGNGAYIRKPYTRLAEMSGVHVRAMFDIYRGLMRIGARRSTRTKYPTVSLETMDKIVTLGMGEPERWHQAPLDLYYLPIDEWTEEMRARHEGGVNGIYKR